MQIMMVGAGIIGTIYGWAFAEAGHEVTHLVRPGRAARFSDGVPMDVLDKRKGHQKRFLGRYPIRVTETLDPAAAYDVVVVPTKHYDLEQALAQIVPAAGQADFLLLTQNWKGTDAIDARIPRSRYVFGDAKAGGAFKDGLLFSTISSIDVGKIGSGSDASLNRVVSLLASADVPATVQNDMLHYLWVQYAVTGGLWPALVHAGSFEAALRDRQTGERSLVAVRECLEVVAKRGADLSKFSNLWMYTNTSALAKWVAFVGIQLMFRFDEYMQRSSAHGLADPKEIRAFYYDLLNTGRELGLPMSALSSFEQDIIAMPGVPAASAGSRPTH